ncbi:MAG: inorganic diphosphatase [Nitrospina sp.]|nr:inorganic diphosphatase [Nitrospina sp.]
MKFNIRNYFIIICMFIPVLANANDCVTSCGVARGLMQLDPYTLVSKQNLWKDIPSFNEMGQLNVVIEIPAGRTEKWETRKSDGALAWNIKKGKPRVVKYIGYPGNYGMIPQTILPKELGGDGDALDVIVLGPPLLRGSIEQARLIGVLRLLDDGEQDDKLIAVSKNSPFYKIDSIKELDQKYPGVSNILELWFENYKGEGEMESRGFFDVETAESILQKASDYYLNSYN